MKNDPWIQTYTGRKVSLVNPRPCDIDIEDIAHALSNICRFTGHTREFYSVAQHSIEMVNAVLGSFKGGIEYRAKICRAALMHDAAETYLGDMNSPLKSMLPGYKLIEEKFKLTIIRRFKIEVPNEPMIRQLDIDLLLTEVKHLLSEPPERWEANDYGKCLPCKEFKTWSPEKSKSIFMVTFDNLFGKDARINPFEEREKESEVEE